MSLLTDQDSEGADDAPKVTLMTIHSAKGLEFKNVFVVGLEENLFPSPMAGDSYKQLEEERRLFVLCRLPRLALNTVRWNSVILAVS